MHVEFKSRKQVSKAVSEGKELYANIFGKDYKVIECDEIEVENERSLLLKVEGRSGKVITTVGSVFTKTLNINKMNKPELIDLANANEIAVDDDMKVRELRELLNAELNK